MDKYQLITFADQFVNILVSIITYAIIGRVLMSWFTVGRAPSRGPFSRLLFELTEPVYRVVRIIPHKIGMIDLSPLIALIGMDLLRTLFHVLLVKLATIV